MSIYLTQFIYKEHVVSLNGPKAHWLITGKNGSGKTSLLKEIYTQLTRLNPKNNITEIQQSASGDLTNEILNRIKFLESQLDNLYNASLPMSFKIQKQLQVELKFNKPLEMGLLEFEENDEKDFVIAFFDSKRVSSFEKPKGITSLNTNFYNSNEKASKDFVQYLVNLQAEKAFAYQEKDGQTVKTINNWFKNLRQNLGILFETDDLKLDFNRRDFSYTIKIDGQEMDLFKLSDGFASIMYIISEIIMRMKNKWDLLSDGIVIIDEIETHLHVSLQKKILKFLTDFFPNIQFIVSTHSPFVLSSISNSIVYDMEKKQSIKDMSAYSYESLVEDYFEVDQYSHKIKEEFSNYLDLVEIQKTRNLTIKEQKNMDKLIILLSNISDTQAPAIKYKFYESELKRRKYNDDSI